LITYCLFYFSTFNDYIKKNYNDNGHKTTVVFNIF